MNLGGWGTTTLILTELSKNRWSVESGNLFADYATDICFGGAIVNITQPGKRSKLGRLDAKPTPAHRRGFFGRMFAWVCPHTGKSSRK